MTPATSTENDPPKTPARGFQRDLARLLLVFLSVALVDLAVISLFTGKLRIWFPQWINPGWATDPDSVVVYSQSYFAGILLIPVLLFALHREFLKKTSAFIRGAFWTGGLAIFGFILWWKGGLMFEHDKQTEALAFGLLSLLLYALALAAEHAPRWIQNTDSRTLLRRLLTGLAAFFLIMAIMDPVVQVGIQKLPWSFGLIIEMVFFIPAGFATLYAARRLQEAVRKDEARC